MSWRFNPFTKRPGYFANFTESVNADPDTDITAAEAETLTDNSDADSLHKHTTYDDHLASTSNPHTVNLEQAYVANALINTNSTQGAVKVIGHLAGNSLDIKNSLGSQRLLVTESDVATPGSGPFSTKLGISASAAGSASSAFGDFSNAGGANSTALGAGANASGDNAVSIGTGSVASSFNLAMGVSSNSTGLGSIAMGSTSKANETGALALGGGANVAISHVDSIAMGANTSTTKSNQLAIGSGASGKIGITEMVVGKGVTNFSPGTEVLFLTTSGVGPNRIGTDYVIKPGGSTGTGISGKFCVRQAPITAASSFDSNDTFYDRIISFATGDISFYTPFGIEIASFKSEGETEFKGGIIVNTDTITSNHTLLRTDHNVDCNSTSDIVISEIATPVNGQEFVVTNVNAGIVTFDFDISGDSETCLSEWEGITIRYNSTISKWVATEY